jgi:hypothetical protein
MNWCPTIGMKLAELGRVKEAEFEVIEPKKEQHGNDETSNTGGDEHADPGPTIVNRSYTIFTEPTTT